MKIELVKLASVRGIAHDIKRLLNDVAKEAYIFGSFAEGIAIKNESDVDLLIIPKKKLTLEQAYDILDPVFRKFIARGVVLHIIIYDPKRHSEDFLKTARNGIRVI